jgi:hypothetical protein
VIQRALTDAVNRIVTVEELQCALAEPISTDEREEDPSSEARLAYVRHAYRRWRPTQSPR